MPSSITQFSSFRFEERAPGRDSLLDACMSGHRQVAEALIKAGIGLHTRDEEGCTPKAYCVLRNWDIAGQLPADPHTEELIERRVLAHFNGIGSSTRLNGVDLPLEGMLLPYTHKKIADFLRDYFGHDEQALIEAFRAASHERTPQQYLEALRKGKLTIVLAGWEGHAVNLVFYGSYMCIANGGRGLPENCTTLEAFRIDPRQLTEEILAEILAQKKRSSQEGHAYFYVALPEKLAARQNDLCHFIGTFSPKPIKVGICCMAAAKGTLRAAMMLLRMCHSPKNKLHRLALSARKSSKAFSVYCRQRSLELYLHAHYVPNYLSSKGSRRIKGVIHPDRSLIRRSFKKVVKHTERLSGPRRELSFRKLETLWSHFPHPLNF